MSNEKLFSISMFGLEFTVYPGLIQKIATLLPFKKLIKSGVFEQFTGTTCIVVSSLYVPAIKTGGIDIIEPLLVKPVGEGQFKLVSAPQPVTGVRDCFGLSILTAALGKFGIHDIELKHDPLHPADKSKNLILIGSPTSNLVGEELYRELPRKYFAFTERCDQILLKGQSYGSDQEGMYGIVLKCQNPWKSDKGILWLAGIGPTGTEAAIRTIVGGFNCVPKLIRNQVVKREQWVIVIKGVLSNGYVTDVKYVDSSYEL